MFSGAAKVMGEMTGVSDNCSCYFRANAATQFTYGAFLLPDETPYILFKSIKEEYCFTDMSLVVSAGEAAVGKKRTIRRFEYANDMVDDVSFETAGVSVTDLDCEIKFRIGGAYISLDVKKSETELAVMAYRVILELSRVQQRCAKKMALAADSIKKTFPSGLEATSGVHQVQLVHTLVETFNPVSYKEVFERLTPT